MTASPVCGHCGAVGAENGVGVEQGDERFKISAARGGQEGLDYFLLAAPVEMLMVTLIWPALTPTAPTRRQRPCWA